MRVWYDSWGQTVGEHQHFLHTIIVIIAHCRWTESNPPNSKPCGLCGRALHHLSAIVYTRALCHLTHWVCSHNAATGDPNYVDGCDNGSEARCPAIQCGKPVHPATMDGAEFTIIIGGFESYHGCIGVTVHDGATQEMVEGCTSQGMRSVYRFL